MLKDPSAPEEITKYQKNSLFDWLKFTIILSFTGAIIYKILTTTFNFNFAGFDFNALLALVLSIFAIALSVLFYLKASETSNKFYDNSYKFTQHISEILGRIEERFGEKLAHIETSNIDISARLNVGFRDQIKIAMEETIDNDKKKLEIGMNERDHLLNAVLEKAALNKVEQEQFKKQLLEKETIIATHNEAIQNLERRIMEENITYGLDNGTINILSDVILKNKLTQKYLKNSSTQLIASKYQIDRGNWSELDFIRLIRMGIIDSNWTFTLLGIRILEKVAAMLEEK